MYRNIARRPPLVGVGDCGKFVLQNIIKSQCFLVFMLLDDDTQLLIELSYILKIIYIYIYIYIYDLLTYLYTIYFANFRKIICSIDKDKIIDLPRKGLIDWLIDFNVKVILCLAVRESHSSYIYIYLFV